MAPIKIALLLCLFVSATAWRTEEEVRQLYEEWRAKHRTHSANFGEDSRLRRFEIFKDNLRYIDEHNRQENNHSYELGLNCFADLTNEEFRSVYLGKKSKPARREKVSDRYKVVDGEKLPAQVDWRKKGAVPPVKDQGNCGNLNFILTMLGLGLLGIFSGINGFMGLFLMGRRKPLLRNGIIRFWAFCLTGRRGSLYSGTAGFWAFS